MNDAELKQLVQEGVTLQVGDRVRLLDLKGAVQGFNVGNVYKLVGIDNGYGARFQYTIEGENETHGYTSINSLERV